jgi:hypothetical protein
MADDWFVLDLRDVVVPRPVLLFGIPQFGGFGEGVGPRSGTIREVFALGFLVVGIEAGVLGGELVCVSLGIVREVGVPS